MTELVTTDNGANAVLAQGIAPDADITQLSYSDLINTGEFYQIPGFGLVTDKDLLIGVPHVVVGVTFQMPVKDKAREANNMGGERDYVTLRALVADDVFLREAEERQWIPGGKCAFREQELICYNDGSTGIRRDIVRILDSVGLISIGHENHPNRLDLPWTMWDSFSQSAVQGENIVPEFTTSHTGSMFVLKVGRGLRKSQYSNDYAEDAVTYYL